MSNVNWEYAKEFIGVKRVLAMVLSLGDYNIFRGWTIPANEDPDKIGYIVKYPDGYISWCPREQFEKANALVGEMTFGSAIAAMKKGMKVARAGWNGKGMFLIYIPGSNPVSMTPGTPYFDALNNESAGQSHVAINPHIDMFTATGEFQPGWLANQADMLAEDWCIVE